MSELFAVLLPLNKVLGEALSGPDAALARRAIGRVLVRDELANDDELIAALQSQPDASSKLEEAAQLFRRRAETVSPLQVDAREISADSLAQREMIAAKDRQDARSVQMARNDRTSSYLAYGVTAGFFLVLFVILFWPSTTTNAAAQTLVGVLGTAWVSIVAFYFGSSVGSKEKTSLLEEQAVAASKKAAVQ